MPHRLPVHEISTFKDTYFERSPVVLTQVPMLANSDEAFAALAHACKLDRQGAPTNIKAFVDGMMVTERRHPVLPCASDTSLYEYRARLLNKMPGAELAIYCGSVQIHSSLIFDRARMLLRHLFGPGWLPAGSIDLELFLGQYTFTPGGIHQEPRSNIHYIVTGNKDMLVWQPGTWEQSDVPSVSEYTSFVDQEAESASEPSQDQKPRFCEILNGDATDLLYWPPNYWHVGRSPEFSVSINVAVYSPNDPFQLMKQAVSDALWQCASDVDSSIEIRQPDPIVSSMPRTLQKQLDRLRRIADSDSLAIALAVQWTKRRTSLSFLAVPPRLTQLRLSDDQELSKDSNSSFMWIKVGDMLIYGANGHAGSRHFATWHTELFELIESGQSFTLKQIARQFGHVGTKDQISDIFTDLLSIRAISPLQL